MLHIKIEFVPTTTRKVVEKTTCDFCGTTIPSRRGAFREVTLQCDSGTAYPEGGSGEKTLFDCCAGCWDNKVLPELRALGGKPRVEQWEF